MKYTGRNLVQYDLFIADIQGMPGVGSALEAGNNVIFGREIVYDLSFSFISPLEA